ncbi:MAG TPA: hypothetical protein VLZ74_02275, partial [Methylocella sp.]|nr:hypothetical protein [Methylocella sp.]
DSPGACCSCLTAGLYGIKACRDRRLDAAMASTFLNCWTVIRLLVGLAHPSQADPVISPTR